MWGKCPPVLVLPTKSPAVQPPAKPMLCCWVPLGPTGLPTMLRWLSKVQSDVSGGLVPTISDFSLLSLGLTKSVGEISLD